LGRICGTGGRHVARVVISGYYGFGNIGDEAVLAGIAASLRERCDPSIEIVVHSINPDATTKLHGLRAVHRYRLRDVVQTIRASDLMISGGGSLLQDVTSARSPLYYLGIIRLARMLGRRVMIYGQGIGPIRRPVIRFLTRVELDRVNAITVRDEGSRQALLELGVRTPRIEVAADPSFAVEPAAEDAVAAALAAAGVEKGEGLVGVSLRPWPGEDRWLPEVAAGIRDAAAELQARLVFLPLHASVDRHISSKAAECAHTASTVFSEESFLRQPRLTKALVGSVGLMVGMRLHALMFAASMGVPAVAISYDPKVREFAHAAGMPVLGIETVTGRSLTEAILASWQRRKDLGELARQCADQMRERALLSADIACRLCRD